MPLTGALCLRFLGGEADASPEAGASALTAVFNSTALQSIRKRLRAEWLLARSLCPSAVHVEKATSFHPLAVFEDRVLLEEVRERIDLGFVLLRIRSRALRDLRPLLLRGKRSLNGPGEDR